MSGVDWFQDPESWAWDRLELGDSVFGGLVTISGSIGQDLQVDKGKGKDGARIIDSGIDPAELTIVLRMISEEDFNTFKRLLPQIQPRKKGEERKPIVIKHPAPNLIGIEKIYTRRIHLPTLDNGILSVTIEAIEWIPDPKPTKQGKKAEPSPGFTFQDYEDMLTIVTPITEYNPFASLATAGVTQDTGSASMSESTYEAIESVF